MEKQSDFKLMVKSVMLNNPGIDKRILDAFKKCDRKFFAKKDPYIDRPQHILHGQTISQPSTIARMLAMLKLEKGMDVLEIGTNTGYHAALAAQLVYPGTVSTIEIFPDLAESAKKNIARFIKAKARKLNIEIFAGDALDKKTGIWGKKYDIIYFTAGVDPDKIKDAKKMAGTLLKDEGLALYPTRESWDWGALEMWQKKNNSLKRIRKETGYVFVPLLRQGDLKELYEKQNYRR
ncbi:MAG: methyltransferase domain-containing protein [Candidatus Paceibacterota bacterium]